MLAVTTYSAEYVLQCREAVSRQLQDYQNLREAAPSDEGGKAAAAFEAGYINSMVLALDHYFLHRQRSLEGKDGNPINEVRMLCDSIKDNGGVMKANATIKYDAGKAVTGIAVGEKITLSADQFWRLAEAFFEEVEKRYS